MRLKIVCYVLIVMKKQLLYQKIKISFSATSIKEP